MVYIRTKQVMGKKYLYLVRSVWDSKKSTSRQEIIKYLGRASEVGPDDIPPEYRDNPRISAFLAGNTTHGTVENEKLIQKLREVAFRSLTIGDTDRVLEICKSYTKTSTLGDFYEDILRPVMYGIGESWANNVLSIADEHVASNAASRLVGILSKGRSMAKGSARILICVPSGEEHSLGCNVMQSFLQNMGHTVFNLSPSAPAETIIHFIKESEPDVVLISITIKDNIRTGQRLVKKIQDECSIPILVGGQALKNSSARFGCSVMTDESLKGAHRAVMDAIGGKRHAK